MTEEIALTKENILLLKDCTFNLTVLNNSQIILLKKISKYYKLNIIDLSIEKFISMDLFNLKQEKNTIKKNNQSKKIIINKIKKEILKIKIENIYKNKYSNSLIKYNGDRNSTWKEIIKKIIKEINYFQNTLDEKELIIFNNRFGLNGKKELTLDQTAKLFTPFLTRERIRQIENNIITMFLSVQSINKSYLLYKINNEEDLNISYVFKGFFKIFNSKKEGIRLLSHLVGVKESVMKENFQPKYNLKTINSLFMKVKIPVSKEILYKHIEKNYGYCNSKIKTIVDELIKKKDFEVNKDKLYTPKNLSAEVAILQASLNLTSTFHFSELYEFSNKQKLRKKDFKINSIIDNGLLYCVDNNYIYLIGKGIYGSLNNSLTEKDINFINEKVYEVLKKSNKNKLKFKTEIYDKHLSNYDFYIARHIVRNYSYKKNIYFFGRSGLSVVSFEKNYSRNNLEDTIQDLLKENKNKLTFEQLKTKLEIKSSSYLNTILSKLVFSAVIVRIGNDILLSEAVYKNYDLNNILIEIEKKINKENKAIEFKSVSKIMVEKFKVIKEQELLKGLIYYINKTFTKNWFFTNNVLSNKKIDFISVTGLIEEYAKIKKDYMFIRCGVLSRIFIEEKDLNMKIKIILNKIKKEKLTNNE